MIFTTHNKSKQLSIIISVSMILLGLGLYGYSTTLLPYTNQQEFNSLYLELQSGQSTEFWNLRNQYLTPKYRLEDYGITISLLGLSILLITLFWKRLAAPKYKLITLCIGLLSVLLTYCTTVFDLYQGLNRGEFPHWADSIGIPMMGLMFTTYLLIAWSLLHSLFLIHYKTPANIISVFNRKVNKWLAVIITITALIVLFTILVGDWLYTIPGLCWLYYYFCLAAGNLKYKQDAISP